MTDEAEELKLPKIILTTKRGKGRPKVEFDDRDLKLIYRMCKRGFPLTIMAGLLGCSKRTLERRITEDSHIFDIVNRGKSEAYIPIFKTAFEMAQKGNERFLLYFMEKCLADQEYAQNLGTLDVTNDKNVIEGELKAMEAERTKNQEINKKRLLAALAKDKFLQIEGSTDPKEVSDDESKT